MKIGVLGTGMVGQTIATKMVALGHEVRMGSRTRGNEKATAWVEQAGERASEGTFADAAAFGELVFHCAAGAHAMAVIESAAEGLKNKILIDVSNPLDFSNGFPPTLSVCNDDSLGERIQRALPDTKVVKTLNTLAHTLMVDPGMLGEETDVFVSGDDVEAKQRVTTLLTEELGHTRVTDLGDLSTSRGTEAWLLLWTRLYGALGDAEFNLKLVRKPS
ncbi:MAG TPA: NAD(P)-binding domain-containing protein [Sandaracinaceae bacterium LLY-WYZ-13_1]|nr:NAD(P)-binding domain-containing protein [Sandaracinaceae bacterium LLY-WYZ-13_1]